MYVSVEPGCRRGEMGTRGEARLVPAVTVELRTEHLDFLLWAASSH